MRSTHLAAALFLIASIAPRLFAQPADDDVRGTITKSLRLLEKSAATYTEHRQCFSCHHQALPALALVEAKKHGFAVNDKELARQLKFTADFLGKNRANYEQGKGQGGQADTAGYALLMLHTGGWEADATTSAVIEYLLLRDKERGYWQNTSNRPPTEASPFTTTYLGLAAFKNFGPASKNDAIKPRIDKARQWLLTAKPKDNEDRVFRLRALKLAGADAKAIQSAADQLANMQRDNGGWSQIDTIYPDPYATGTALVALHQVGGWSVKDERYQRGLAFLLDTQKDDGSWHVRSRSKPFQLYFESGFPHTKDQFISIAATSWATMALTLSTAN